MVACTNLSKRFGEFVAVDGLDLEVCQGTVAALLGQNGAGNSTTIQMLAGMLSPTSGSIKVAGLNVLESPVEGKRKIGVVPEKLALFNELTVEEHLVLSGDILGLSPDETDSRTDYLLAFLSLEHGR